MTDKPIVTASYDQDMIHDRPLTDVHATWSTPGVHVSVEFQLHDHHAALHALERAVADVRAQIEETK